MLARHFRIMLYSSFRCSSWAWINREPACFLDKLTTQVAFEYLGGEFMDYPKGYVLLAEIDGSHDFEIEENFSILHDLMVKNESLIAKVAVDDEERENLISARKNALPA